MNTAPKGRLGPKDVDSLIKSLHDRSAPSTSTPSAEADRWRERGNDRFRAGAWKEAAECYTASLEAAPSAAAHANRAMALLKLHDYAGAEADATAALKVDRNYVKAWLRQGAARRGLGNHAAAVEDFEAALALEPGNKAAAEERRAAVAAWAEAAGAVPPTPTPVPVRLAAGAVTKTGDEALLTQVETKRISEEGKEDQRKALGVAIVEAAAEGEDEEALPPLQAAATAPMEVEAPTGAAAVPDLSDTAAAAAAAALRQSSLRPPRTGVEFERAWRGFKSDMDQQAAYLRLIDPAQLPVLLKQALTPQLLAAMVTAALGPLRSADPSHAAEILKAFPETPRFAMNVLSWSAAQRKDLATAWDAAPDLSSLRKPYNV